MIHVKLRDNELRPLPFYLAMEEWVAKNLPADDYFFSWRVSPTVIFGRNQNPYTEVDLTYCRENSIKFYRRKSGGGCVFADEHNIMFSYITPAEEVTTTFASYTEMIASMLRSLGIDAQASGRNDIQIGERKVSGNSFYHIPGRSIVHGTMLYETDLKHMANAITPSKSKLLSNQVQSVESRITTLHEYITMPIDEFEQYAVSWLTDKEITLTEKQIEEIRQIAKQYYDLEWIFGRKVNINPGRHIIKGVGEFNTGVEIAKGVIRDINIEGDFFAVGDIDALYGRLRGVKYSREDIEKALEDVDTTETIAGLTTNEFINLITT